MQEAIDKVSFIINLWNDSRNEMYMPDVMELLRDNLKDLLEIEKEQIIDAHINGQSEFDDDILNPSNKRIADYYYNKTYI